MPERAVQSGLFTDIEIVVFDVGGVLLNYANGLKALSRLTGVSYDTCLSIWERMDKLICRGDIDPQELWQEIKRESSIQKDINFVRFWVEHFKPISSVHQLVKEISQVSKVALLTNIYPGVFDLAMKSGKIPDIQYSLVIQSCQVGQIKPEIGIYKLFQSLSQQSPEKILFIDDNPDFLKPAQNLGWNTYLFKSGSVESSVTDIRTGLNLWPTPGE